MRTKLLEIDDYLALNSEPRFHGMGFIQLPLPNNHRLHIFGLKGFGPIIDDGVIHDHTWLMKSEILFGMLNHVTYEISHNPNGKYTCWPCAEKETGKQAEKGFPVNVIQTGSYYMGVGSRYEFKPGEFHTIKPDGLCITNIEKIIGGRFWPRAIAVGEGPPDNAYPIKPPYTVKRLWEGIDAALAEAKR